MKFTTKYYTDDERSQFFTILNRFAKEFGCYYIAYLCEESKNGIRMGFSSNPDWQNEYVGNQLLNNCHLKKYGNDYLSEKERHAFILPWETVKPATSIEKDIMLYRSEFDIGINGISFATRYDNITEYFAVAPDNHNPNFLTQVNSKLDIIKSSIDIFRQATVKRLHTPQKDPT